MKRCRTCAHLRVEEGQPTCGKVNSDLGHVGVPDGEARIDMGYYGDATLAVSLDFGCVLHQTPPDDEPSWLTKDLRVGELTRLTPRSAPVLGSARLEGMVSFDLRNEETKATFLKAADGFWSETPVFFTGNLPLIPGGWHRILSVSSGSDRVGTITFTPCDPPPEAGA